MAFEDLKTFGAPIVPPTFTQYKLSSLTITAEKVGVVRLTAKSADGKEIDMACTIMNGQSVRVVDAIGIDPLTVNAANGFNQLVAAIIAATTVDTLRDNVTNHLVTLGLLT